MRTCHSEHGVSNREALPLSFLPVGHSEIILEGRGFLVWPSPGAVELGASPDSLDSSGGLHWAESPGQAGREGGESETGLGYKPVATPGHSGPAKPALVSPAGEVILMAGDQHVLFNEMRRTENT